MREQIREKERILDRLARHGALVRHSTVRRIARHNHAPVDVRGERRHHLMQRPLARLVDALHHLDHVRAVVGKVAHQLLLARLLDPSLALGERRALRPARTVGAEGHNVDRLAAVDGEDENVRVLGQQHLRRVGVKLALFLAQRSHEPLARDQPTVGPAATPHQRVGAGDGRGSAVARSSAPRTRLWMPSQPITRSASWVEPSSK